MTKLPDPLPYSFAAEAAAEARAASRRYWAPDGEADRKYPVHKDVERWWKLKPQGQADVEAAIGRMRRVKPR
jgi:hypothetical protein